MSDHPTEIAPAQPPDALATMRAYTEATREIMRVVSGSRHDEQPVFEAILEAACRLCDVPNANLVLVDDQRTHFRLAANWGTWSRPLYMGQTWELDTGRQIARSIPDAQTSQVEDLSQSPEYLAGGSTYVHLVDGEGLRARLCVPLIEDTTAFGCIVLISPQNRPFTPDQVALVETFATQAVIAIENTRQFRALQTRLEREAATREILQVISQSRDNEQPVFDVILKSASRLCNAPLALLSIANAERTHVDIPALLGPRLEFAEYMSLHLPLDGSQLLAVRTVVDAVPVRIDDIRSEQLYDDGEQGRIMLTDVEGARSLLAVPMVSNGQGIGAILLYRREVAPFTDDDLVLVQSFAAQAVIAIENVRQFRELQTRLEREAATKEILQVISQSRDDEKPVFDVIVESAARLCSAPLARLLIADAEHMHFTVAASMGDTLGEMKTGDWVDLDRRFLPARSIVENTIIHRADMREAEGYKAGIPVVTRMVDEEGIRAQLMVPLSGTDMALGCIVLNRREVSLFSDDDIALVQSFAAQAVIAIENVRQFREIGERNTQIEALNASLETRVEEQVGEIERMGRLKRFLSPQVADAVISSGDEGILSSHRALIGILFCDIRGFTAFCETAEPEETIEFLQTYHEEMGKLINAHGAGVDHRWGDGIMVIFNDPFPCEDPAGDALRLSLAMREKMVEICLRWKRLGHRLGFGVGISLGYATVGMVGSEGRFDYTASGTAVNLAARLCDHAEDGEILLSPRAYTAVEDDFQAESTGELSFKGIRAPVEVFRVVDASAQTSQP